MVWGGAFMKLRVTNNPITFFSFNASFHSNCSISPTLLDFNVHILRIGSVHSLYTLRWDLEYLFADYRRL